MYKLSKQNITVWPYRANPGLMISVLVASLLLSACAGNSRAPGSGGEFTVERAENRWNAILTGDYETGYEFYSPGYRSRKSLADFTYELRSRRVHWTSAQYKEHSCLENSCTALFDVGFTVIRPAPGLDKWDSSQAISEKWVKTDGQWWFLPEK